MWSCDQTLITLAFLWFGIKVESQKVLEKFTGLPTGTNFLQENEPQKPQNFKKMLRKFPASNA